MLPDLRGLSFAQLNELVSDTLKERPYRTRQLFHWIHGRGVDSWAGMTDLPKALRARLDEVATLDTLKVDVVHSSPDGTCKLRLSTRDALAIECVLIPDERKLTLCVSSQVGCALGCRFCATAKLGLSRNLTTGEIVDQVYRAQALLASSDWHDGDHRRITNLVFMGMGEPLLNYEAVSRAIGILSHELGAGLSFRRMTLSTAGVVPGIARMASDGLRINLAISLNAASDETRSRIMPVNRKWGLASLIDAARAYPLEPRRRLTFEYVLIAGVNDSVEDARRLAELLRGFRCKLNLIAWNPFPGAPGALGADEWTRPTDAAVWAFQETAKRHGLPVYLRASRGSEISAACGQLAAGRDRARS
ncbi:MAG: 23S rRNA (adenine(2503)-C(2))-methyltransferase RlmN [Pseudomonadota bacterium]